VGNRRGGLVGRKSGKSMISEKYIMYQAIKRGKRGGVAAAAYQ